MTSSSPSRPFGRASVREVAAYTPDAACDIDLSDNTNLWGPPPAAVRTLARAEAPWLARYPEGYSDTLKEALADYAGTTADRIVVGCGSDDVLDAAIRAGAEPGQRLAMMDPTFVMIPALARVNGLEVVRIPITPTFGPDVQRFVAVDATITYLCTPNNPTGVAITPADLEAITRATSGLVIIDEAYMEFAGTSATDLIAGNERVLIARTLSKAFGLAGLRVGYAIGAPTLIAEIEKSRGPFKVSAPAERAAVAALREDREWLATCVTEAVTCRERFVAALRAQGLSPLPSAANFVLVPIAKPMEVAARMRTRGIAVRGFGSLATIGGALRMTIGPWAIMERTAEVLAEAIAECA